MFAFAIWDTRRRRLLLARDRVGKNPLKYAELPGGGFAFASELKALLALGGVDRAVDVPQIHHYLTFGHVPAPHTGFERIRKLEPGHRLVWEAGAITRDRYWSLDYRAKRDLPADEWRQEVRRCVQQAVERRMVADVPLGAFLSGGVDSSIVVACMARASGRPIETFSIVVRVSEGSRPVSCSSSCSVMVIVPPQMQPRGFGIPPIRAASLAGPFGKSS